MERKERASKRNAALLWTSILWSFLKTTIWTWPQISLSYCELRLKPHPLIQFYFATFYYLFCECWHVRLCISRMAFNFPFTALGLTWIECVLCLLVRVCVCARTGVHTYVCTCVCVCVCALCECTQHRISPVKTAVTFEYPEYAKLPEWVRGARQNVSLEALTCFIHEDHTNKLYDMFVFFHFSLVCLFFGVFFDCTNCCFCQFRHLE